MPQKSHLLHAACPTMQDSPPPDLQNAADSIPPIETIFLPPQKGGSPPLLMPENGGGAGDGRLLPSQEYFPVKTEASVLSGGDPYADPYESTPSPSSYSGRDRHDSGRIDPNVANNDEERYIANLNSREFSSLLRRSTNGEKTRLRKIRRLLKNRSYARGFRHKQQMIRASLNKASSLNAEYIDQLKTAIRQLTEERDFYKLKAQLLETLHHEEEDNASNIFFNEFNFPPAL